MSRPLRLGVVSYLNVEPIVAGLRGDPRFEIVRAVPSRVAQMLHAGEIDLGTIPTIEYARGDYAIVPGIAIASRGPVLSVRLVHHGPLQQVRRVALDTSSRTSVALVRILLRERLGRDPEYLPAAPDLPAMLACADAALLIGDPALALPADTPCLDLGHAWWELTGLPFVYAFWAGRPGCVGPALVEALQESLLHGLASIPALAAAYNGGGAQAGLYETYLRDHIAFALGAAERAGLAEFYRRAHGLGLIPRAPELRFHGHP